jgi:rSAM/selenodomain-associated transferase 1
VTIAIVVMSRYPYAGEVKTRLGPKLAPAERAALYHAFLLDKLTQLHAVPSVVRALAFTPVEREPWFRALVGPDIALIPQPEGPLGVRVTQLFDALLAQYDGVILADSDTPHLPAAYLAEAARALEAGDPLVIGPAEDGGYYLIGLSRPPATLFEDIEWSSSRTREQTLQRALELGLTARLLPIWYDVDRPDDLSRLEADLSAGAGSAAPHTWAVLQRSPGSAALTGSQSLTRFGEGQKQGDDRG